MVVDVAAVISIFDTSSRTSRAGLSGEGSYRALEVIAPTWYMEIL
jgi:hypothetical protein